MGSALPTLEKLHKFRNYSVVAQKQLFGYIKAYFDSMEIKNIYMWLYNNTVSHEESSASAPLT